MICPIFGVDQGGYTRECLKNRCQLWCEETFDHIPGDDRYRTYRAGCGLVPISNRLVRVADLITDFNKKAKNERPKDGP